MPFRVITARLDGKSSDADVLSGVLSLSEAFNSHIYALFARPDPRVSAAVMDDGIYPGVYDKIVSQLEHDWASAANKALIAFDEWRVKHNIREQHYSDQFPAPSAEWQEALGIDNQTVGHGGRVSDVLVTAMPSRGAEPLDELGFESALFDAGRPVLLMPQGDHSGMTTGKVIVAWNASPQAFRAVSAALPILTKAEAVLIYTAAEEKVTADVAQKLVTYLKWHGVHASALPYNTIAAKTPEEGLLAAAETAKASLLVMGAYTHSRVREVIFGGMTRHVLDHANLPVLMAH